MKFNIPTLVAFLATLSAVVALTILKLPVPATITGAFGALVTAMLPALLGGNQTPPKA